MTAESDKEVNKASGTKISEPALRSIALIIDTVIILFLTKIALVPLFLPTNWDILEPREIVISSFPAYAIGLLIFLFRDILGGSPGKWLFNIRVVNLDAKLTRPNFIKPVIRTLCLFLLPLEIYFIIRDKHARRIGDRITGTVIVQGPPPEGIRFLSVRLLMVMFIFGLFWLAIHFIAPLETTKTAYYGTIEKALNLESDVTRELGNSVVINEINSLEGKDEDLKAIITASGNKGTASYQVQLVFSDNRYLVTKIRKSRENAGESSN